MTGNLPRVGDRWDSTDTERVWDPKLHHHYSRVVCEWTGVIVKITSYMDNSVEAHIRRDDTGELVTRFLETPHGDVCF